MSCHCRRLSRGLLLSLFLFFALSETVSLTSGVANLTAAEEVSRDFGASKRSLRNADDVAHVLEGLLGPGAGNRFNEKHTGRSPFLLRQSLQTYMKALLRDSPGTMTLSDLEESDVDVVSRLMYERACQNAALQVVSSGGSSSAAVLQSAVISLINRFHNNRGATAATSLATTGPLPGEFYYCAAKAHTGK